MMNKQQTSYKGIWKYALLIPVITLLVGFHSILKAENQQLQQEIVDTKKTDRTDTGDSIYAHVDAMPAFPGGEQEMIKFLTKTMKYPTEAQKKGIQGRVVVRFVVMPDGSVQNVVVMRSVDPLLDAEAIRVIESMPNWIPGRQNGVAVAVYYTMPIVFKLADEKQTKSKKETSAIETVSDEEKKLTPPIFIPKNPLILLDGKEISQEEMSQVKPENIERVDVLKDAAATSAYGERGKNGVILVSSKKLQ